MEWVDYANEEIKHFHDLVYGLSGVSEEEKEKLIKVIRLELMGAWKAGYEFAKR